MPGQSNYPLGPNPGQPGQLFDNERSNQDIVTVIAAVVIPFGVLCELTAGGLLQPLQDSGTTTTFLPNLVGVSVLDTVAVEEAYVPYAVPASGAGSSLAGYPKGYAVPVLRRGRIWTAWDGNTGIALPKAGAINVIHSSTGANPQGVLTTRAAQTTVGNEIDALPLTCQVWDPNGLSGAYTDGFGNVVDIVVLSLNLPGHA